MRLIDADALIEAHYQHCDEHHGDADIFYGWSLELMQNAPTIDAVPVVRCKECRWYVRSMIKQDGTLDERYKPDWCDLYRRVREETYFCADGERKDDDKSCDTCKHYDKWWDDIICDGCTKAYSNWERRDNE